MVDGFFYNKETMKIELWDSGEIVYWVLPNTIQWAMIVGSIAEVEQAWEDDRKRVLGNE